MPTPLYPTFKKRVGDSFEQLIKKQVIPWSFMTAGPPFRIKFFDGKEIAYGGIAFEQRKGTPAARVERRSSQTSRCASIEDHQPPYIRQQALPKMSVPGYPAPTVPESMIAREDFATQGSLRYC